MHAGPASKLKGIIEVELNDVERDRTHDRFVAVYRQVHAMIRDEVAIAMQSLLSEHVDAPLPRQACGLRHRLRQPVRHLAHCFSLSPQLDPVPATGARDRQGDRARAGRHALGERQRQPAAHRARLLLWFADRHPDWHGDRIVWPSCGASSSPTPSFSASFRRRR